MSKLSDVDPAELRSRLADAESAKAAKRLVVALAYLDGVSADDISDRYGFPRSTVYSWLDRFEQRGVDGALADDPRPGRPRDLRVEDFEALASAVADPPREVGLDADEWTPELLVRYVRESYDVSYSLGHARRLLRELEARERR